MVCRFSGLTRGSYYFSRFYQKTRIPWFHGYNIPRRSIVSLNRLRSGHISLRGSLFRLFIVSDPLCPICEEEEDANHIFWQCQRFIPQRQKLIDNLIREFNTLPVPVESLLFEPSSITIYSLNQFIMDIEIYI